MEKFDIPLAGHSVAVAVNGDISADTLKSYAKTFTENKLNYAFVGQHLKISQKTTVSLKHLILLIQLYLIIVLSDGSDILPPVEEFAELTYKHNKPLLLAKQLRQI